MAVIGTSDSGVLAIHNSEQTKSNFKNQHHGRIIHKKIVDYKVSTVFVFVKACGVRICNYSISTTKKHAEIKLYR
jgi:hypothetical protein